MFFFNICMSSGEEQITYGTWKKVTELLVNTVEEPTKNWKKYLRLLKRDKQLPYAFSISFILFVVYNIKTPNQRWNNWERTCIENTGKLRDKYSQMCSFLNQHKIRGILEFIKIYVLKKKLINRESKVALMIYNNTSTTLSCYERQVSGGLCLFWFLFG